MNSGLWYIICALFCRAAGNDIFWAVRHLRKSYLFLSVDLHCNYWISGHVIWYKLPVHVHGATPNIFRIRNILIDHLYLQQWGDQPQVGQPIKLHPAVLFLVGKHCVRYLRVVLIILPLDIQNVELHDVSGLFFICFDYKESLIRLTQAKILQSLSIAGHD